MLDSHNAFEWLSILGLVFGGCCSNVVALEDLLKTYPNSGVFLTFIQFIYVALQSLPSQLERTIPKDAAFWLPRYRLRKRKVPLRRWAVQVVLFFAISVLNNVAFSYKVPVAIHIIFRSGGLCVSMFLSWLVGAKRYNRSQVLSAVMVTSGIVIATLYAPKPRDTARTATTTTSAAQSALDASQYLIGLSLLALALVLSAFLGLWQEGTYKRYGNCWEEGLFYQHVLSLPLFAPMLDLQKAAGVFKVTRPMRFSFELPSILPSSWGRRSIALDIPYGWILIATSLSTQGLCIRGVNRLTGQVSSVTVQLVLTIRKAVSLAISVTYFGSGYNAPLVLGAGMVLAGTTLYASASDRESVKPLEGQSPPTDAPSSAKTTAIAASASNGLRKRT